MAMWRNLWAPVCLISACFSMAYLLMETAQRQQITNYAAATPRLIASRATELGTGCTLTPPNLISRIPVDQSNTTFEALESKYPEVTSGGRWEPKNCTSHSKVAILVPYRDRKEHLKIFLRHMHGFLQKQLLNYTIFVIEQTKGTKFNRGFLFNVGVSRALLERQFDCFIFHDVDLLPENENNLYQCQNISTHLSTGLSKWNYRIVFPNNFGGVTMMLSQDFIRINGFSNRFHGWGAEDNDNRLRILSKGMKIYKTPTTIGRYTSLNHKPSPPNPNRSNLLARFGATGCKEGFNTTDYQLVITERRPLYTRFLIQPNYVD